MRINPCTMAELPPHKLTFKDFLDVHLCPSLFFDLHLAAMIILLKFIILSNVDSLCYTYLQNGYLSLDSTMNCYSLQI